MNISKNTHKPKYVCDKCENEIRGYHKNSKEYVVPNKYYKGDGYNYPKKDFDLCSSCEKKFRKWLSEKEIPRIEDIKDNFPRWEED